MHFSRLLAIICCVLQLHVGAFAQTVNMDLSSVERTAQSQVTAPIVVNSGGQPRSVDSTSHLTPAELVAVDQILQSGRQSIILDQVGRAVGGTVQLMPQAGTPTQSLVIPAGVTVLADFAHAEVVSLLGDLVNSGKLYAYTTSQNANRGGISAVNILNHSGALISSLLSSSLINSLGASSAPFDLNLTAGNSISNRGTIVSSGGLNLVSPLIQNAGQITATAGDINVSSLGETNIVLDNANGILSALAGNINVRETTAAGKIDFELLGGDVLANALNIHSGDGAVALHVNDITALINVNAGELRVTASTDHLRLGNLVLSGDPTFSNDLGDVSLSGNISTSGEDLVIAAKGNVIWGGGTINTAGGDIAISAGTDIAIAGFFPVPPVTPGGLIGDVTLSGDILTNGGQLIIVASRDIFHDSGVIDTSSATNGGHILMVAGIHTQTFISTGSPFSDTTYVSLASSGNIDLTGTTMLTAVSPTGVGGSIQMGARNNITVPQAVTIEASSNVIGSVILSAGGAVTVGNIDAAQPGPASQTLADVHISGRPLFALGNHFVMGGLGWERAWASTLGFNSSTTVGSITTGGDGLTIASSAITLAGNIDATGTKAGGQPTVVDIDGGTIVTNGTHVDINAASNNGSTVDINGSGLTIGTAAGEIAICTVGSNSSDDSKSIINISSSNDIVITGGLSAVGSGANGAGGKITIMATAGDISAQGAITANAVGSGHAGKITMDAGFLSLDLDNASLSANGGRFSGNLAIDLKARNINILGHSSLTAQAPFAGISIVSVVQSAPGAALALGPGAGQLAITAPGATVKSGGNLSVDGAGIVGAGLTKGASWTFQAGTATGGGAVTVSAPLSANSNGDGPGGVISLTSNSASPMIIGAAVTADAGGVTGAGGTITMVNAGTGGIQFQAPATISVAATDGDGGTTSITTAGPISLNANTLSADAAGAARYAGNITLDGQSITVTGGSAQLSANGTNGGGTIAITTRSATSDLTVGNDPGEMSIAAGPSLNSFDKSSISISAGRNLAVDGAYLSTGGAAGIFGTSVTLAAGTAGTGTLQVTGDLTTNSNSGEAGNITLSFNSPLSFTVGATTAGNFVSGEVRADGGTKGGAISVANTAVSAFDVSNQSVVSADGTQPGTVSFRGNWARPVTLDSPGELTGKLSVRGSDIDITSSSTSPLVLDFISASQGNVMVTKQSGALSTAGNARITAGGGQIKLLNTDTVNGSITIGNSTQILGYMPAAGQPGIVIAVGDTTALPGPTPSNTTVSTTNGASIYWGTNGIAVPGLANSVSANTRDIVFSTSSLPAGAISIGSNVSISSNPKLSLPSLVVESGNAVIQNFQTLGILDGSLASNTVIIGPNVSLSNLSMLAVKPGFTLTLLDFDNSNPVTVTGSSTLKIEGTMRFLASSGPASSGVVQLNSPGQQTYGFSVTQTGTITSDGDLSIRSHGGMALSGPVTAAQDLHIETYLAVPQSASNPVSADLIISAPVSSSGTTSLKLEGWLFSSNAGVIRGQTVSLDGVHIGNSNRGTGGNFSVGSPIDIDADFLSVSASQSVGLRTLRPVVVTDVHTGGSFSIYGERAISTSGDIIADAGSITLQAGMNFPGSLTIGANTKLKAGFAGVHLATGIYIGEVVHIEQGVDITAAGKVLIVAGNFNPPFIETPTPANIAVTKINNGQVYFGSTPITVNGTGNTIQSDTEYVLFQIEQNNGVSLSSAIQLDGDVHIQTGKTKLLGLDFDVQGNTEMFGYLRGTGAIQFINSGAAVLFTPDNLAQNLNGMNIPYHAVFRDFTSNYPLNIDTTNSWIKFVNVKTDIRFEGAGTSPVLNITHPQALGMFVFNLGNMSSEGSLTINTIGTVENYNTISANGRLTIAADTLRLSDTNYSTVGKVIGHPFVLKAPNGGAGTIASPNGDVVLPSKMIFHGRDLAILASGDVLAPPGLTTIDLSSGNGDGGNLTVVAGFDFTSTAPPSPDRSPAKFSILQPSSSGGSIVLPNVSIKTSASASGTNGGDVTLVAAAGTDSLGVITIKDITAKASTSKTSGLGQGGAITLIGAGGVMAGALNSSGAIGGNVTVVGAQPQITGGPYVIQRGGHTGNAQFVPTAVVADSGAVARLTGGINASGAAGAGGNVQLLADHQVTAGAILTRGLTAGGAVVANSLSSSVLLGGIDTSGFTNNVAAGGSGGSVTLQAPEWISINGNINAQGGSSSSALGGGYGGDVLLSTGTVGVTSTPVGFIKISGYVSTKGGNGKAATPGGSGGNFSAQSGAIAVKGVMSAASINTSAGVGLAGTAGTISITTADTQTFPDMLDLLATKPGIPAVPGGMFTVGLPQPVNGTSGNIVGSDIITKVSVTAAGQAAGVIVPANAVHIGTIDIEPITTGSPYSISEGAGQKFLSAGDAATGKRTMVTPSEAIALFQLSRGNGQTITIDTTGATTGTSSVTVNSYELPTVFSKFNLTTLDGDNDFDLSVAGKNAVVNLPSSSIIGANVIFTGLNTSSMMTVNSKLGLIAGGSIRADDSSRLILAGTGGTWQSAGSIEAGSLLFGSNMTAFTLKLAAGAIIDGPAGSTLQLAAGHYVGTNTVNVVSDGATLAVPVSFLSDEVPSAFSSNARALFAPANAPRAMKLSFAMVNNASQGDTATLTGDFSGKSLNIETKSTLKAGVKLPTHLTFDSADIFTVNDLRVKSAGAVTVANSTLRAGELKSVGAQTLQTAVIDNPAFDVVSQGTLDIEAVGSVSFVSGNWIRASVKNVEITTKGDLHLGNYNAFVADGGRLIMLAVGNVDSDLGSTNANLFFARSVTGYVTTPTGNIVQKNTPANTGGGIIIGAGLTSSTSLTQAFGKPAGTKPAAGALGTNTIILNKLGPAFPEFGAIEAKGASGSINLSPTNAGNASTVDVRVNGAVVFETVGTGTITIDNSLFQTFAERPIAATESIGEDLVVDTGDDEVIAE